MATGNMHGGPPSPLDMEGPLDHQAPLEEEAHQACLDHQEVMAHLTPWSTRKPKPRSTRTTWRLWTPRTTRRRRSTWAPGPQSPPDLEDLKVIPDWDLEYKQQEYQP